MAGAFESELAEKGYERAAAATAAAGRNLCWEFG